MAKHSVPQARPEVRPSQMQRRWQVAFRQRMQGIPQTDWRCVGVDIGKYEHVAAVTDGWGQLLTDPLRFSLRQAGHDRFFALVDRWGRERGGQPLIAMEPTGHYFEQLAYEAAQRYGPEQVYLVQAVDVAQRRRDWNRGSFKNDEVDACIISQVLREGHGRPYRPPSGVYLKLYHLERYRLAREQACTRLKNQILGHLDRLFPGLIIRNSKVAQQLQPNWGDPWQSPTLRRLLEVCPDPYQLRQHSPHSLYQRFRTAHYWMTRPYATKILAAVQALCLPNPALVAARLPLLAYDLASLAAVEQEVALAKVEMVSYLDQTWGYWLRPTGVDPAGLASLVATIGDIAQYQTAQQLFGRSGLHSGCHDSGTHQQHGQGQAIVKPGDRHLRRTLMRFTFSMLPRYPALRRYEYQLSQRGLGKIAVHVATARKLSGILYRLASHQEPFDPQRLA